VVSAGQASIVTKVSIHTVLPPSSVIRVTIALRALLLSNLALLVPINLMSTNLNAFSAPKDTTATKEPYYQSYVVLVTDVQLELQEQLLYQELLVILDNGSPIRELLLANCATQVIIATRMA
jgi:hypothetical protein